MKPNNCFKGLETKLVSQRLRRFPGAISLMSESARQFVHSFKRTQVVKEESGEVSSNTMAFFQSLSNLISGR
jgi:hypothetical protein